MPISEFSLIARYFTRPVSPSSGVALGIGDDAALVSVPPDQHLAIAIDTLVAGVHFAVQTPPGDIAYKALAVNLSDLAAMGATPCWLTLALTLPSADPAWLEAFAQGLFALSEAQGLTLIGGDTTRGPLCVTVQVAGLVPVGEALTRRGACPGDGIYITGTLGDAALALAQLQARTRWPDPTADADSDAGSDEAALRARLHRPVARVQAGRALRGRAHAAIDISDGLLADLGHILTASGVGASLDVDALPRSAAFRRWERAQVLPAPEIPADTVGPADTCLPLELLLSGGDDYELCLCLPPEAQTRLAQCDTGVALTRIGVIEAGSGLHLHHADGRACPLPGHRGYTHF